MIDPTQNLDSHDRRFEEILAEYVAAEESGSPPDRQELLARHPAHAADLQEFFANRDRMQRMALPLQAVNQPANGQLLGNLRYFGDYELLHEIAAGGMGVVYKARQVSLNRVVAVKMILRGTLASEDDIKRFRAEAEAAASLQHPGIVPIHEIGLHEGQHYFSMEYVEGRTLAEILRDRPLSANHAAAYVWAAADAVQFAHQRGTLHRDLKPSNVLIDHHEEKRGHSTFYFYCSATTPRRARHQRRLGGK
jgi:eukaryotic-like serine/threonine-protein kinase